MPRFVATAFALLFLIGVVGAQGSLPPRFKPLAGNPRFRLERVLGTPEVHPAIGATFAFSADGKWAIFAENSGGGGGPKPSFHSRLLVWDLRTKGWPREIDLGGRNVAALDLWPDGSKAVLGCQIVVPDKKNEFVVRACILLVDLNTGKTLRTIDTTDEAFFRVVLAPDQTSVLTCGYEKIKQWSLKDNKDPIVYDPKNKADASALAYLPGGKQFLAGYRGGEVRLFDVGKETPVRKYESKGANFLVLHLAVAPDGKRFAAGDIVSTVSLFDIGGKEIGIIRPGKPAVDEIVSAVALADDGKTVLAAWAKQFPEPDDFACARLQAWDAEKEKKLWSQVTAYRGGAPILLQGDKVLIGGGPNWFEVRSVKDGTELQSWGGHRGPVASVGVRANGDVLSAGLEGTLMTWRKGILSKKEIVHKGAVTAFALNKDRTQWLTAGADLNIRSWPPDATRAPVFQKKHTGPITALTFAAAGNWSASASADRSVKTWFMPTGAEIATLTGHSEGVNAVAISPDGRWIASGSDDATIRVWPVKDGKPDADRDTLVLEGHKKAVTCLAFTADGKALLSGSQDNSLKLWNWDKEKAVRTMPVHKNWITSITLLDDGTALTTSDDLTICLWDIATGNELGRIDFGAVGDCPRCATRLGADRILVGTSSWLIYEFQILKSKAGGSSK